MPDQVEIEERTQELGRDLFARLDAHAPSSVQRLQDRLMVLLMEDESLRNRLLRFVDTLAALPPERSGRKAAALLREYLRGDFRHVPTPLRAALAAVRSPLIPAPLIAAAATLGARLIASRFIVRGRAGGVERALTGLETDGRYPSFDLLGEAVLSEPEALRYRRGYLDLLTQLGRHPMAGRRTAGGRPALEISLKLSALTPQFNVADPEGTLRRLRPALEEVCEAAARARGIGVTVDAEQYAYRELTWYVLRRVFGPGEPLGDWPDIGMVVQAYLADAASHARDVRDFASTRGVPFRVRLVKGAYWDQEVIVAEQAGWPVPVHRDKTATDLTFEATIRLLLERDSHVRLAVASHNIRAHAYAEAVREVRGLPEGAVEHQTLYKTLEGLSRGLHGMGWPARDYVPVGELIPGMAYLVRRILENTSQVGFLTRSRLHEEAGELLRPPRLGAEDPSYRKPSHATGFANAPPPRFFEADERERFREALAATRARWGARYPLFIGGEEVETEESAPSWSPSLPRSAGPVGWVSLAGAEEAERAIAVANAAAPSWAARSVAERVEIGLRAARLLYERKDTVAALVVHEGGRTWHEALADVEEAIDHISWNARQLQRQASLIAAEYRPRGVIACIPPWNFPSALPAGMTSAALLAGNAVILKPAGPTPIVAGALVDILHEAGAPSDALILLPGRGSAVGARLVESPDVDMVAFTGSKDVGTWIHRAASAVALTKGGVKRVVAELGGKNAIVVFPDADMDEAVQGILRSAFGHAGQKCSACSRVLVHRDVRRRLTERLVEAARSLPIGPADDPSTVINPVIDVETRDRILGYGDAARGEGRVVLDTLEGDHGPECCVGPLIVEVDAARAGTARVAQEEMFAPILPVIPFESEEQAVEMVNGTVYALALGIYSRSPSTIARMMRACDAGNIYVNRETVGARVGIEPFGGYRLSGTGPKTGSEEYLAAFLTRRSPARRRPTRGEGRPGADGGTGPPPVIRAWHEAPPIERARTLRAAVDRLRRSRLGLRTAIEPWASLPEDDADSLADEALRIMSTVLDAAPEVVDPQPTVDVPGQTNFVLWTTPRGVGVVAVDEGSSPEMLAGLVVGPLLAGNGLLVAAPSVARPFAEALADALWWAGVPREVLAVAPSGATPEALASGPVHFAAADLPEDRTRALHRVLGETDETGGQHWLKALVSMGEGPRPGEPGFVRLFAHPKAVAVRTLRHGADLKFF